MDSKSLLGDQLIQSRTYRDFLKLYLEQQNQHKKINFSELSRRAGFSSRSFIKEVMDGKKSLTPLSVGKMKKALKLTALWGHFFEALVTLDEPMVNIDGASRDLLLERLERLKFRLKKKLHSQSGRISAQSQQQIFVQRYLPEIYAALGSIESGASIDEIKSRCDLSEDKIMAVLKYLLGLGAIVSAEGRFTVKDSSLDIFNLGENIHFKDAYSRALVDLQKRAETSLECATELFLHSAFSVSERKLPEFKLKLRSLIIDFIDEAQEDLGEKVVKLTVGLYR